MIENVLDKLKKENLFVKWGQEHPRGFLSHFFMPLDSNFKPKSSWEIGYYANEKITVFVEGDNGFAVKPEDKIFKKPDSKVEKLELDDKKLSFEDALEIFKTKLPEKYPNTLLGDGFVILQTYESKTVWNFTFITKKLKFVNLKINAVSGDLEDSQEVDLVQKKN